MSTDIMEKKIKEKTQDHNMLHNSDTLHKPVMLAECLDALNIKLDGIYIDATFGRGGHSSAILQHLGQKGRLIAIDRDLEAIASGADLAKKDNRFNIFHQRFSNLKALCDELQITGHVNGLLLDLGVSSPQFDNPNRGFSFQSEGPLDMRMDTSFGETAEEWINHAKEDEIAEVLKNFGEERFYRRIARGIIFARKRTPITTPKALAEVIVKAKPVLEKHRHAATQSFQAIRMFINQELSELSECLSQAIPVLAPKGRLVVLSFHSIEDRVVKQFMKENERGINASFNKPSFKQKPSATEIKNNRRARSAMLRCAEKREVEAKVGTGKNTEENAGKNTGEHAC